MSVLKFFVILSFFFLIFLNCLGIKPCIQEQKKKDQRIQAEKSFDPWKMEKENPIIIQEEESVKTQEEFSPTMREKEEIGEAKTDNEIYYQIQIFASKFPEEAQNLVDALESNFGKAVNIDYEAPYYKVRLGEFETQKKAENFLRKVRQKGFPQAWVVKIKKEDVEENDQH